VQRFVGHQVAERHRDPVEQRVEALLREDVVEDLREPPVRLDERLGASATVRLAPAWQRRLGAGSVDPRHFRVHRLAERLA
jgi:hypothetical protein